MTSERLLNMSIEVLYLPQKLYPQNNFLATPLAEMLVKGEIDGAPKALELGRIWSGQYLSYFEWGRGQWSWVFQFSDTKHGFNLSLSQQRFAEFVKGSVGPFRVGFKHP